MGGRRLRVFQLVVRSVTAAMAVAPAGNILFAGEHTSPEWQGYMNGALTTGQRAAMEVLALAGRLP